MSGCPTAGLLLILALAVTACSTEVHQELEEREANEIVVVLREAGVVASKRAGSGGWAVRVPTTQTERALQVMVHRGLPRRETNHEQLLAESGGMVPSAGSERARRVALVEEGLEQTLLALDGVHDAFVHAVIPDDETGLGSRTQPQPPRMSIVLVERPGAGPSDDALRAIALGAVEGLTADRIAIVRGEADVPEPAEPLLEQVGPFAVAAESVDPLRRTLCSLGGLLVAIGATLIVALARRTRA